MSIQSDYYCHDCPEDLSPALVKKLDPGLFWAIVLAGLTVVMAASAGLLVYMLS